MGKYPLPKFHFQVEWGGTRIGFSEVSGLTIRVDVIEYREGSSVDHRLGKIPGMAKFSNITLKRGIVAGDNEFFAWWNTIALNQVERRSIVISLLNENHEPAVVWKVRDAFPVEITWSDLNASASEVVIESLEIAHEGIVVEHAGSSSKH